KYSYLIFDTDHIKVENQFQLTLPERNYKPDFVLTNYYGLKDIVEIKTHNVSVVKIDTDHNSLYFTPDFNKALGQLQSYLKKSIFASNNDSQYFSSSKGIIIIGQRKNDQKDNINKFICENGKEKMTEYYKSLRDLKSSLYNIEVIYFDDIIEAMKIRLNKLI
ncbi:MAG: Shedu anti-phage system protein SduA domain-containing protein, partial [Bacilli bacterium]